MDRSATVLQRRLAAEWELLQQLARINPERLGNLRAGDLCLRLELRQTPALALGVGAVAGELEHADVCVATHEVLVRFPMHFPAAPMEMYLATPVQHPNIHPETGFVCLWDRHRVSHTVEHALHKLAAMLGWRLLNRDAVHVMQPAALKRAERALQATAARLAAPPLMGVTPAGEAFMPEMAAMGTAGPARRRRLL